MSLLTLKDIGKIYVSEGNVAVGIRGVNLSFDRGEFVAVTGKSGSGKSTLLNVISGMDTYEEGDLLIEGRSTAHFCQPDWETYRQEYISFIFQDYNIIESYTVLQNVELALMHISDRKERRAKAVELLTRVGMKSHLRQKGSKLSGGQKQRTVIARALAKDSPIILADEPTGNLDSVTSAEIIDLLREVSRDKLVIIVTHNFEQVEHCATRHIRIFDGAVESDRVLNPAASVTEPEEPGTACRSVHPVKNSRMTDLRNGITLGNSVFTSRPKLSLFLCLLLILGTFGMFLVTAGSGDAVALFQKETMFRHINGRVVLTRQNGEVLTDEELKNLTADLGAQSYLHYDRLLDEGTTYFWLPGSFGTVRAVYTYGKDYGTDIIGRYPEARDEVFLYMPISCQPVYGKDAVAVEYVTLEQLNFRVVGVKYFYDNNQTGEILLTDQGFRNLSAAYSFSRADAKCVITINDPNGKTEPKEYPINGMPYPSFAVEPGKVAVSANGFRQQLSDYESKLTVNHERVKADIRAQFTIIYYSYNYDYVNTSKSDVFIKDVTNDRIVTTVPENVYLYYEMNGTEEKWGDQGLYIGVDLLTEMSEEFLSQSYRQASLFFANDKEAARAAERLGDMGYIAVPSDTTYSPDAFETILTTVSALFTALVWVGAIIFLAFFINLCSGRTVGAFRGDMAIMRSMGIPVRVIRVGMYVRMLIALIPAYIVVVAGAFFIYLTPRLNPLFTYLYLWQYAVLFLGMFLLTLRVTQKQVRRLFGESVKKNLKGGNAE